MTRDRHVSPLAGFGVGPRADRLYRTLLRGGGCTIEALAARVGMPVTDVATDLECLTSLGLVASGDDLIVATSPQLALARLIEREAEAIARRENDLDILRTSIVDYAAEEHGERDVAGELEPMEVHSGAEATAVVNSLLRATRGPLLVVHPEEWFTDPGWSKRDSLLPLETRGGRPTRSIYPAAVLHRPEDLNLVYQYAEIGEDVRLMARPPSRLIVFGDEAILVPVEWGRTPQRRIVIRTPGVVEAFRTLFELLWRSSTPLPGRMHPSDDSESQVGQIMRMLASGAKDETIARHLGLSLRTVRRRVAELMRDLGADTRFQAGVEAARRHKF